MKWQQISFGVILAYLWILFIILGSIILETFMIYPNIFHNPPDSFAISLEFMSVAAPSDFFPPLGFLTWVTGVLAVIVGWRVKDARYWILASLLMIIGEGVASMTLFWPRNTIMFIEGLAVHSPEFLRQTAQEFEAMHWLRVGFNVAGSLFAFIGCLKFYRHMVIEQVRRQGDAPHMRHAAPTPVEQAAL